MSIERIIHQTGPTLKSKWHPRWEDYAQSWKRWFPDYEYRLWNDEDIDAFMQTEYPEAYGLFKSYPHHIQRVDMFRYYALFHYGGIYADLDFECFQRFALPEGKVSIAESPYDYEILQNALMASPKGHPFWKRVFTELEASNRLWDTNSFFQVLSSTGPQLLVRASKQCDDQVHRLPREQYSSHTGTIARHHGTFSWSSEIQDMEHEFTTVYAQKQWGYKSGPGSVPDECESLVARLTDYIGEHAISSICDVGCGYVQWIPKLVSATGVSYIGVDCVKDVLDAAQAENPGLTLQHLDVRNPRALPRADMYFIKDVLQHWPSPVVRDWLQTLLAYAPDAHILICNCRDQPANRSIAIGQFAPLSHTMEPLNEFKSELLLQYGTKELLRIKNRAPVSEASKARERQ